MRCAVKQLSGRAHAPVAARGHHAHRGGEVRFGGARRVLVHRGDAARRTLAGAVEAAVAVLRHPHLVVILKVVNKVDTLGGGVRGGWVERGAAGVGDEIEQAVAGGAGSSPLPQRARAAALGCRRRKQA